MYGEAQIQGPLGADKQDLAEKLTSLFYGVMTPMLNPHLQPEEQGCEGCCGESETPN